MKYSDFTLSASDIEDIGRFGFHSEMKETFKEGGFKYNALLLWVWCILNFHNIKGILKYWFHIDFEVKNGLPKIIKFYGLQKVLEKVRK